MERCLVETQWELPKFLPKHDQKVKYIDALWDFYLPDEEQPSIDNASNGGVAELSDEQDPEEEGEEDGEEEEEGILDGGSSQVEG